jgi:hypothetical protein
VVVNPALMGQSPVPTSAIGGPRGQEPAAFRLSQAADSEVDLIMQRAGRLTKRYVSVIDAFVRIMDAAKMIVEKPAHRAHYPGISLAL